MSSATPRPTCWRRRSKQLFPEAQVTIGPVIEDGFFYDFAYSRPFTPEDLAAIEARMLQILEGRPAGEASRAAA